MAEVSDSDDRIPPTVGVDKTPRSNVPTSRIGWWAVFLAAAAVISWTALPVVGALVFGEQNSGGFMFAAMVLAVIAAVFNLLAVSVWKQRSILSIVAVVLTVPNAVVAVAEAASILLGG